MKTPVLIAAYNEEALIGQTLRCIPADLLEPIVAVNGSSDQTANIARSFGATVLESSEPGKLPAIQRALYQLGERALEPVLYLDADAFPAFPRKWPEASLRKSLIGQPWVGTGLVGYHGGRVIDDISNSLLLTAVKTKAALKGRPQASGANMATYIKDFRLLKRILDMPHIWLGEDAALAKMITMEGGRFDQTLNPYSLVLASSRFVPPISELVRLGRKEVSRRKRAEYIGRAAPGSRPYHPKSKLGI